MRRNERGWMPLSLSPPSCRASSLKSPLPCPDSAAHTGGRRGDGPAFTRRESRGLPGGREVGAPVTMRRMKKNWLVPGLAGGIVAVMSVVGGLLPYPGVMDPPQGFDPFNFVGAVEKPLWVAVAAIAASRPYTRRFAA